MGRGRVSHQITGLMSSFSETKVGWIVMEVREEKLILAHGLVVKAPMTYTSLYSTRTSGDILFKVDDNMQNYCTVRRHSAKGVM